MGLYKTYMLNLNDFEDAYKRHGSDLLKFIDAVKARILKRSWSWFKAL